MTLLKVNGYNMVRDTNSGALINKDQNGLNEYLKTRNMMSQRKSEIEEIKNTISSMKSDLMEIKMLLTQLSNKG